MNNCLIVVDYQNDFVNGSLGFPEAGRLEGNIAKKIEQYRKNGGDVIFTFDTHRENYLKTQEGKNLPVTHCIEGTAGHMLYGQIGELIQKSDKRFYKDTFGSDGLYEYLKTNPYESIELVGLVSNICVIANAVLAKTAQPETPICVDAACTASHDGKLNEAALDVTEGLQIQVINRKERSGS